MKLAAFLIPILTGSLGLGGCQTANTAAQFAPVKAISHYYVLDSGTTVPRPGLTVLPIHAVQQTTDYSCGPAAALTLLNYYGKQGDEMTLAKEMGTHTKTGTTLPQMAGWLQAHGFKVQSGEGGSLKLIRENLSKKTPTLVEWSDWGGHWVLAIGYDTRNTIDEMDDVIIFADPYDRHDDRNDGVTWFNAQRFYYMWYDSLLFGKLMKQIYITATPLPQTP
jgi:hypothetical protein